MEDVQQGLWQPIDILLPDQLTFLFYDILRDGDNLRVFCLDQKKNIVVLSYSVFYASEPIKNVLPSTFLPSNVTLASGSKNFLLMWYNKNTLSFVDLTWQTFTANKIEPPSMKENASVSLEPTTGEIFWYQGTGGLGGLATLDRSQKTLSYTFYTSQDLGYFTVPVHWESDESFIGFCSLLEDKQNSAIARYEVATKKFTVLVTFQEDSTFFKTDGYFPGTYLLFTTTNDSTGTVWVFSTNAPPPSPSPSSPSSSLYSSPSSPTNWQLLKKIPIARQYGAYFDRLAIAEKSFAIGGLDKSTGQTLYVFYSLETFEITSFSQEVEQPFAVSGNSYVDVSSTDAQKTKIRLRTLCAPGECLRVAVEDKCKPFNPMTQASFTCTTDSSNNAHTYVPCDPAFVPTPPGSGEYERFPIGEAKTVLYDWSPQVTDNSAYCAFAYADEDWKPDGTAYTKVVYPWYPADCSNKPNFDTYTNAIPCQDMGGSWYHMTKCQQKQPLEESDPELKNFCKLSGTGFTGTKTSSDFPIDSPYVGPGFIPPPVVKETFDAGDKICGCEFPRPEIWNKDELVEYCGNLGRAPLYTSAQQLGRSTFTKDKTDIFQKCSDSMEAYCREYPDQCMTYCNRHALDPLTGKWCNEFVVAHCKAHPNSDECRCINSDIPLAVCNDQACLDPGTYKTNEMLKVDTDQQCPKFCQQVVDINRVGRNVNIDSNAFNIKCNLRSNKKPAFGLKTWYTCKDGQCVKVEGEEKGTSTNPNCCSADQKQKYQAWKTGNIVTVVSVSVTILVIVILIVYYI